MTNVVNFNDTIETKIEEAILDALDNRCGKWVSEAFVVGRGMNIATQNVKISDIINRMVDEGKLERTFQTVSDKFGQGMKLYSYRIPINYENPSL